MNEEEDMILSTPEATRDFKKFKKAMDKKQKQKKKVYCKDCRYCGDVVYLTIPGQAYFLDMPRDTVKNFYGHGIEVSQRYCKCSKVKSSEEVITFYKKIKNNYMPLCHEANKDNNCKYFKKKD